MNIIKEDRRFGRTSAYFRKNIVKSENLTELEKKRKLTNLIKNILEKECKRRTGLENKSLGKYLYNNFDIFKIILCEEERIEKISSIILLEKYKENYTIFNYGEKTDKLFILLDGKLAIYQPYFLKKKLTIKDYINYLLDMRKNNKYIYERVLKKNTNINIDNILKLNLKNPIFQKELEFFIEKKRIIKEVEKGYYFGELSILNTKNRKEFIISLTPIEILSINKDDYKRIIYSIEQNKLRKEVEKFKLEYPLFNLWSTFIILKIFHSLSTIQLKTNEFLYKQNDKADGIYIIENGKFEIYSLIKYKYLYKYIKYILNQDFNLLYFSYKYRNQNENKIKNKFEKLINKKFQQSPFQIYKSYTNEEKIINKSPSYDYIKILNKSSINDNMLQKISFQKIEGKEILGLEESLEFKQRFCFIKCISETAVVKKLNLFDLFNILILIQSDNLRENIIRFLSEKKNILIKQFSKLFKSRKILDIHLFDLDEENQNEKNKHYKNDKIYLQQILKKQNKISNNIFNSKSINEKNYNSDDDDSKNKFFKINYRNKNNNININSNTNIIEKDIKSFDLITDNSNQNLLKSFDVFSPKNKNNKNIYFSPILKTKNNYIKKNICFNNNSNSSFFNSNKTNNIKLSFKQPKFIKIINKNEKLENKTNYQNEKNITYKYFKSRPNSAMNIFNNNEKYLNSFISKKLFLNNDFRLIFNNNKDKNNKNIFKYFSSDKIK